MSSLELPWCAAPTGFVACSVDLLFSLKLVRDKIRYDTPFLDSPMLICDMTLLKSLRDPPTPVDSPINKLGLINLESALAQGNVRGASFGVFSLVMSRLWPRQKDVFFPATNSRHAAADVRGVLFVFSFHALRASELTLCSAGLAIGCRVPQVWGQEKDVLLPR